MSRAFLLGLFGAAGVLCFFLLLRSLGMLAVIIYRAFFETNGARLARLMREYGDEIVRRSK